MHSFEGVTAVLFAALNHYVSACFEDENKIQWLNQYIYFIQCVIQNGLKNWIDVVF